MPRVQKCKADSQSSTRLLKEGFFILCHFLSLCHHQYNIKWPFKGSSLGDKKLQRKVENTATRLFSRSLRENILGVNFTGVDDGYIMLAFNNFKCSKMKKIVVRELMCTTFYLCKSLAAQEEKDKKKTILKLILRVSKVMNDRVIPWMERNSNSWEKVLR